MKYASEPDRVYLSLLSLDDPELFPPERHIYWTERRKWLELADTLPRLDAGTSFHT
jgi:hypothetical protein